MQLVVLKGEKIRKKFEKENTKREAEGEKPLPEKELRERLKAADELEKTIKRDRKNGYEETKMSEERIVAALKKMDERIQVAKLAATDKDEGKGACFESVPSCIRAASAFRCADLLRAFFSLACNPHPLHAEISLETSKINYIDPVSYAFSSINPCVGLVRSS